MPVDCICHENEVISFMDAVLRLCRNIQRIDFGKHFLSFSREEQQDIIRGMYPKAIIKPTDQFTESDLKLI